MSYRRPLNLTLYYTLPFTAVIVFLVVALSLWSIRKHRQEQIEELIETGRMLSIYVTNRDIASLGEKRKIRPSDIIPDGERYRIVNREGSRVFYYQQGRDSNLNSIEIPMTVSDRVHRQKIKRDILSFLSIGLLSTVSVFFISWHLSRKVHHRLNREIEEKRLSALIELAGATAHEMRQPLSVIIGLTELLKIQIDSGEPVEHDLETLRQQCLKMDDIIKKMLHTTHYRTTNYIDGIRILDLHNSAQQAGHVAEN